MKRNANQQSMKASLAVAAAVLVAALSGCASMEKWNYSYEQASLANFGGGGGDSGGGSGGGSGGDS